MEELKTSNRYMQRCLQIAKGGRGNVAPNPLVGCVIVHNGMIIGEGFHTKTGYAHAEVEALNRVKDKSLLPYSTMYVTLEPCSHHGKTPPCAERIVNEGIKNVVIGMQDPDSRVSGSGIQYLEENGVKVTRNIMSEKCRLLNIPFIVNKTLQRPYIFLKWAESQDGFIADENYSSKWLSNPWSRVLVHKWRKEIGAVMVGQNTAIHDDPALTVRDWVYGPVTRIFTDKEGAIKGNHKLLDGSEHTIVFTEKPMQGKKNLTSISLKDWSYNSPSEMLEALYKQGITAIMVEGGSALLQSFIKYDCWDEAAVFRTSAPLGKGVKAPELNGLFQKRSFIGNDVLEFYRHPENVF